MLHCAMKLALLTGLAKPFDQQYQLLKPLWSYKIIQAQEMYIVFCQHLPIYDKPVMIQSFNRSLVKVFFLKLHQPV